MNQNKIKIIAVLLLLCISAAWLERYEIQESCQNLSGQMADKMKQNTDEPQNLYAQSAVLMDADSGRVLFGKEEEAIRPMASTTKIMTCIIALEHMTDNEIVTASAYAASQPKVHLGVREGQQFYLRDILFSLMLESHNDSAVMVAEVIAGSVEAFVKMMNEKAEELGLTKTHFVTPNGLDGEDEGGVHATTAMELAKIMKYCIMDSPEKEMFLDITGTKEYHFRDLKGTSSYTCTNHNAFLTMMDGAISGKTGFTADAGYCYVGALRRDERTFIVALLACGWPNHKGYKWSDTKKLMEYGLSNYEYRNVWQELPKQEIVVKDSGNDQNIYQKNSVAEVEIQQKPEVLKDIEYVNELNPDYIGFVFAKSKRQVSIKQAIKLKSKLNTNIKAVGVFVNEDIEKVLEIIDKNIIGKYDVLTRSGLKKRTFFWCLKRCMERFFCYTRWNTFFVDLR